MDILFIIRRIPELVSYNKFDDDLFDRLNYSHTVAILIVFAIVVTNRQFSENQIKCWVPAQFTGSYEQYVNQICFITNTYSFDMHEPLPDDYRNRHEHELKYYQWTPFILLLMAILFYIPSRLWRGLSLRSGVDLQDLIEAAQTFRSANLRRDDKAKLLEYLTNWLNSYCSNAYRLKRLQRRESLTRGAKCLRFAHTMIFPLGIYTGNYLIISYLLIKFLYLCNSIGQIFLLNTLLGRKFGWYGFEIVYKYWTKQIGLLYSGNEYFPKVVLCDFYIREPNHPKESHRYTVQCVLPFNLFNQQIFTYLYFWLILLSVFNFCSLVVWFYRISPYYSFRYLERRLILNFLEQRDPHDPIRRQFVYHYLQSDGTFMIRLIANNVSDYVCRKIILELFQLFLRSLNTQTIGREPLFQSLSSLKSDEEPDENSSDKNNGEKSEMRIEEETEDDGISHDNVPPDIPPIPNPRQGKIFVERSSLPKLPSDTEIIESQEQNNASSVGSNLSSEKSRLRSSGTPLLKDIRRESEIRSDSPDRSTPRYKNIEFTLEPETIVSSTVPTPTVAKTDSTSSTRSSPAAPVAVLTTTKGPSPYATTYLTTKKPPEHELPYIDDSMSSGSASARTSTSLVRQAEKPTIASLASTSVFFRRSHDV